MKVRLHSVLSLLFLTTALTRHASADLILNGNFTGITNTVKGNSYTYGQFGNNSSTTTGSVLTVDNWDTAGYNFVYSASTVDNGTTAGGALSGAKEAPGQANVNGNGNEFMWGARNGGTGDFSTNLFTGNFIAADGSYEVGAITQQISGLTTGTAYTLTFYWAAAQQESFTTATTEQWQVSLGGQSLKTPIYSLPAKGFSGWMPQTFTYTATAASETLSFLAIGTPGGQPPFVLLGGVSLVPEPSSWMLVALVGGGLAVVGIVRRRRLALDADGLS